MKKNIVRLLSMGAFALLVTFGTVQLVSAALPVATHQQDPKKEKKADKKEKKADKKEKKTGKKEKKG